MVAVLGGIVALAAVVGVGAVALGLTGGAPEDQSVPGATEGRQLNVVVLMTDDQDARSLRTMRAVRGRLQAEGTTFVNSFATFPLCCPSRVTYLTGQYAHNHGVLSNKPPEGGYTAFTDPEGTVPQSLQGIGYRTGHVGKYLNGYGTRGNDPTAVPPGWDEWWAFPEFNLYDYEINHNGELLSRGSRPRDYETDVIRGIAGEFIRNSAGSRPFFLTIAPLVPHTESSASPRDASRAGEGGRGALGRHRNPRPAPRHAGRFERLPLPRPPSFNERDLSDKPRSVAKTNRLDAEAIRDLEERHQDRAASLLAVDEMVTGLIKQLRRAGELDETVFIYTSDNGYLQGEHRRRKKGDLYEESARVPLVIRGPGFPAGARADQLVGNVDLAPTILDIAGSEPGRVLDGRSLLSVAGDPGEATDRALVLENAFSAGVRVPGFAFYEHRFGATELYDLRRDPFQLVDVAGQPEYEEVGAELNALLDEMRDCAGDECLREFTPEGRLPADDEPVVEEVEVHDRARGRDRAASSGGRDRAASSGARR